MCFSVSGGLTLKGLGSQTGFYGPVFFPKSQKPLAVLQVIFSFISTFMCLRYAKISSPKVMKGFVLASDPKMTIIDVFCLFSDNQTSARI